MQFIREQLKSLPRSDEEQLVVLPECVLLFGGHESQQLELVGESTINPLKVALSELAAEFQVYLVAGSIPVQADEQRVFSRCYLFDPQGQTLGQYDKLHLFDVDVEDGTGSYRESDTFCPGKHITVVDTPIGKIGLAICYDLRFPEMFQAMREAGAEIIALPAAFTKVTGEAHWQTLIQARAIETQCYLLAAAQWGQHSQGGRETWGQSMIVDPWGEILAQKHIGLGWVQAEPDMVKLAKIRTQMPIVNQKRFRSPTLK